MLGAWHGMQGFDKTMLDQVLSQLAEDNLLESAEQRRGQATCAPRQRNRAHDITTYSHLYHKS
jgi:hypothetical protein